MRNSKRLVLVLAAALLSLLITACGAIPNAGGGAVATPSDPQSAGAYLPAAPSGYSVTSADSITDALTAAAGEGADIFGNPVVEVAVNRIDSFIQCYQDVGAVSANLYTQIDLGSVLGGDAIPSLGAVAVVNQDRVRENLIPCALGTNNEFSAQAVPTTCQGSGNFINNDDTFTYLYISTDQDFCLTVTQHFQQYGG